MVGQGQGKHDCRGARRSTADGKRQRRDPSAALGVTGWNPSLRATADGTVGTWSPFGMTMPPGHGAALAAGPETRRAVSSASRCDRRGNGCGAFGTGRSNPTCRGRCLSGSARRGASSCRSAPPGPGACGVIGRTERQVAVGVRKRRGIWGNRTMGGQPMPSSCRHLCRIQPLWPGPQHHGRQTDQKRAVWGPEEAFSPSLRQAGAA